MKDTVQLALDWAIRCFGHDHVYNRPIRALRVAEEAVELAQALHVDKDKLHELIDIVYARKAGKPTQEIGGVLMTLNVLCAAHNIDPDEAFLTELRRVLAKPADHFTKRNQDKIDMGLTA